MTPLPELELLHEQATARNDEDWADNDSQRATNQHVIDVQFGKQKRQYVEARAALTQAAPDWLAKPGPDGGPQTERPPMPLWIKLDADQQRQTDIVLAQNARGLAPASPPAEGPMSDALPEPLRDGQELAQASDPAKVNPTGQWRIDLRYLPIAHRGHAYLQLVDPDGNVRAELHGLAHSKHTGDDMRLGTDESNLVARHDVLDQFGPRFGTATKHIATVASGSYDDIVRRTWSRALDATTKINNLKFDYKGDDPAYELGFDNVQIQNSNSVAYSLGRAMGLDLDGAIAAARMDRRFPGWRRDLLDPKYDRYVTPPQFGVTNAP